MSIFAQPNPVFKPAMMAILSITTADPLNPIVTTTVDGINPASHNFNSGTIVRIDIPTGFGMQQINQQFGNITVLTPTTFSIAINTTNYDAFSKPSSYPANAQQAQAVAFGEISSLLTNAVVNTLPH